MYCVGKCCRVGEEFGFDGVYICGFLVVFYFGVFGGVEYGKFRGGVFFSYLRVSFG